MKLQPKSVGTLIAPVLAALLGGILPVFSQPTTLPPTPTLPQGQVIALWNSSQVYTNIADVNFDEWWWSGQMTDGETYTVSPYTNIVQYYATLYFTGVGFEGNVQDVSGCTNLHVDVFTPNGDSFAVRIVDNLNHSADITYTSASGVITNNGWISLDLPLSQFQATEPLLNLHYIQQLGWIINSAGESSPADYYIDNVYFNAGTNLVYTPPPVVATPTNNAATPTVPAASVLAMYNSSGTYSDQGGINWDANWSGSAESSFTILNTGSVVMYLPALSFVGAEFYEPNQIDASSFNTLHFDVWSLDAGQIGVQIVSLNPTVGPQVNVSGLTTNQWIGINIPLSDFVATNSALVLSDLQQLLWIDNATAGAGLQSGTFYIDNVYFYTRGTLTAPAISAAVADKSFKLSFPTVLYYNYTLQYTTNLTGAAWQTLTNFSGTGSTQLISNTPGGQSRFYRLTIQ
jgi:hypothetical protein